MAKYVIMKSNEFITESFEEGSLIVFKGDGRRFGSMATPSDGQKLIVTEIRLKDGIPLWYGVKSLNGTPYRIWPEQVT